MNKIKITFLLGGFSRVPVGGYKVVYEYANRLQHRGHIVTVIHSLDRGVGFKNALLFVKGMLSHTRTRMIYQGRPIWFGLNEGVRTMSIGTISDKSVPDGDVVVATAWRTAGPTERLSRQKGQKFYLVQHYETWDGPKSAVDATWRMNLHRIFIAKWLVDLNKIIGEDGPATHIPNGLDFNKLRVLVPPEERARHSVGMLFHLAKWKGASDGIAALEKVRKAVPDLQVTFFGVAPRTKDIPKWVNYVQSPSPTVLESIYNSCAIFLSPSRTEGWGLTGAEAMACGCALISTDNQGVLDYAENGRTCLLSPVMEPDALADNLLTVLRDEQLRIQIAKAGMKSIRKFTWDRSVDLLENTLSQASSSSDTM